MRLIWGAGVLRVNGGARRRLDEGDVWAAERVRNLTMAYRRFQSMARSSPPPRRARASVAFVFVSCGEQMRTIVRAQRAWEFSCRRPAAPR